jgi:putative membrane protein
MMKHAIIWAALLVGLIALATPTAVADDNPDFQFASMAASGGVLEVMSSRLALDKGGSDSVKKFARQMVEDHGKANQELMELVAKKNIGVAAAMTEKHADTFGRLANAVQDFDAQYAQAQVAAHEEAVALFEKEAKEGKDADLKAWAEGKLPTLREHLKMARDLAKSDKEPKDR